MSMGNGNAPKADAETGSQQPTSKEPSEVTTKFIRVLTVLAYLSSVSMAAIMLSLYYIFLWNPAPPSNNAQTMPGQFLLLPKTTGSSDHLLNSTFLE